jgi:hypothetical protein
MRKALRGDIMKGYFASPLAMNEMSIKDMLLEISTDDLRHVGTIKDRIYMPVHFVQKWVLPTIQVRKAASGEQIPTRRNRNSNAVLHL